MDFAICHTCKVAYIMDSPPFDGWVEFRQKHVKHQLVMHRSTNPLDVNPFNYCMLP
jgi:hypothetical protein